MDKMYKKRLQNYTGNEDFVYMDKFVKKEELNKQNKNIL